MLQRTREIERAIARSLGRKRTLRLLLMVGGILVVLVAALTFWLRGGRYVSADDAYVRAAKLMVSTDVSGLVTDVAVREGQTVKAGDVLFRIDPKQFQIALENAKAQLQQTALNIEAMKQDYKRMQEDILAQQAQVELDQANFDRYAVLVKSDSVSKANYDQARFTLAADKKKVESLKQQAQVQLARLGGNPEIPVGEHPQYQQAKANVDEAQRQLDHTVVRAPFNGIVTQVDTLQPGTYLVSQTAALTNTGAVGLVATDNVWIDAHVKETDLTYVKTGSSSIPIRVGCGPAPLRASARRAAPSSRSCRRRTRAAIGSRSSSASRCASASTANRTTRSCAPA